MEIGKRLHELREARNLSQGDIEKRTGLLRCYISRVENGHTIPALETLERLARALELELYQLFYTGSGKPVAPEAPVGAHESLARDEKRLLDMYKRMSAANKELVLGLARQAVRK